MMQLCRHSGIACYSRTHSIQPHSLFLMLVGLVLSDTTVDSQYASTRDLRLIATGDESHLITSRRQRIVSA
jgi:hypothetical protein